MWWQPNPWGILETSPISNIRGEEGFCFIATRCGWNDNPRNATIDSRRRKIRSKSTGQWQCKYEASNRRCFPANRSVEQSFGPSTRGQARRPFRHPEKLAMKVQALSLSGAYLIAPERHSDRRGYFSETYSAVPLRNTASFSILSRTMLHFHAVSTPSADFTFSARSQIGLGHPRSRAGRDRRSSLKLADLWAASVNRMSAANGLQLLIPPGFVF
jgi:hypothetical protein